MQEDTGAENTAELDQGETALRDCETKVNNAINDILATHPPREALRELFERLKTSLDVKFTSYAEETVPPNARHERQR